MNDYGITVVYNATRMIIYKAISYLLSALPPTSTCSNPPFSIASFSKETVASHITKTDVTVIQSH